MKPAFSALTSAVAFLATTLIPSFVAAEDAPDPRLISIESVSAAGNACQNGTVSSTLSPDGRALSLLFDNYIADLSNNPAGAHDRRTCEIDLRLRLPAGWSMALFRADYRGFANLDPATMGIHEMLYSFPGAGPVRNLFAGPVRPRPPGPPVSVGKKPSFSSQFIRGPYQGDYVFTNTLQLNQLAWSACADTVQTLRISAGVLVRSLAPANAGRKQAMMTLDSIDANIRQDFGVVWRRCP